MPKVDTYACDFCGTLKKDTNHWYRLVRRSMPAPQERRQFLAVPFEDGFLQGKEEYACGDRCLAVALEQWIAECRGRPVRMTAVEAAAGTEGT